MTKQSIKSEIVEAAQKAQCSFLEKNPSDTYIYELFTSQVTEAEYFVDVPIKNFVSLENRPFNQDTKSWKEAALKLKCNDWECVADDIRRYFHSELRKTKFPPITSSNPLTCFITGDSVGCEVGNHRLVAAVVWKAYHEGEDSVLKKVYCYHREVNASIKHILDVCVNSEHELFAYRESSSTSFLLYKYKNYWAMYKQHRRDDDNAYVKENYHYKLIGCGYFDWSLKLFMNTRMLITVLDYKLMMRSLELTSKGGPEFIKIDTDTIKLLVSNTLMNTAEKVKNDKS
ncbi:hypothetical protein RGL59_004582 [Vibrio parahaemolyticus]|nr:hypothetical protein [Vibrio parahaemolyticus]EJC7052357.1 hypothetical protein [Vibrio parahaemolyticus]EJC7100273.1 hypothetical protein [Vibrio parahaemolyticus]EJC7114090.1 hypothetical protein [Vibrio parahaemolyticus]EJC7133365.1 hypothetical protein [Vibrio parahaemolyticus]